MLKKQQTSHAETTMCCSSGLSLGHGKWYQRMCVRAHLMGRGHAPAGIGRASRHKKRDASTKPNCEVCAYRKLHVVLKVC